MESYFILPPQTTNVVYVCISKNAKHLWVFTLDDPIYMSAAQLTYSHLMKLTTKTRLRPSFNT